jgi:V/A-type H+/Na+-transporting ATPase subunit D
VAVKFQYNKTEIQRLNKQLAIREKALPTLKSKETALRLEVKKLPLKLRKSQNC